MRLFLSVTTYLIISLAPAQSFAREYVVEAIVFTNEPENTQIIDEAWDAQTPRVLQQQAKLNKNLEIAIEVEQPRTLEVLANAYTQLEKSPKHRVLTATSWIQAEADYSEALPVNVSDGQTLSGSIRIYAPSLLFAELSLRYAPGDLLSIPDPQMPQFFIDENRKLKLKEVHYFDQAQFGVVLSVRRYEPVAE